MARKSPRTELPIPPGVPEAEQAAEVLRAWIADGQLRLAAHRTFEKPEVWATMLIDFAKHAAVMYEQQGVMTQRDAFMRITGALRRQLGGPGGMDSGQTTIL